MRARGAGMKARNNSLVATAYDVQERMECMEDLRLKGDRCSRMMFPFLQESK